MFVRVDGRIARFQGRLEAPEAILSGALFILDQGLGQALLPESRLNALEHGLRVDRRAVTRGRGSGALRRRVVEPSDGSTLREFVRRTTWPRVMVDTDEWAAYDRLPEVGRPRATVCPAAGEWAQDEDGVREVHA